MKKKFVSAILSIATITVISGYSHNTEQQDTSQPKPTTNSSQDRSQKLVCMQDVSLSQDDMHNFALHFKEECGNAKNLPPEVLSNRCQNVINNKSDALLRFNLADTLWQILPTACSACFVCICKGPDSAFIQQSMDDQIHKLGTAEVLQLDASNIDLMSTIHIFTKDWISGESEAVKLKTDRVKQDSERTRPLSNYEKALIIRYVQARFLHNLGEV